MEESIMEAIPTLIVTNPATGTRATCTGFKSIGQADSFGQFRKMKKSVLNPKVRMMTEEERNKYELQFHHSQKELKEEVFNYFYL